MIIEQMAGDLGLTAEFIELRSRRASFEYKEYTVQKRDGGRRTIHHPSRALKALQRWLLVNVIESFPMHAAAFAYTKGRSIFDNARIHKQSRYLLRMDMANFFPSIRETDLTKYIQQHTALFSDWTPRDIDVFSRLVFRHGSLSIGAPTSPALSNAFCYDLDLRISEFCARQDVRYSRYADDLFFSTERPNLLRDVETEIAKIIPQLELPAGLRINTAKTRHSSKRRVRRVTGIVLGSDGEAYVSRTYKRTIRALLHKYDSLTLEQRASLAGMIAYVIGFEPHFINSLISKYGLPRVRAAMMAAT